MEYVEIEPALVCTLLTCWTHNEMHAMHFIKCNGFDHTQVLSIFRKLHKTRQMIFGGDAHALNEARNKINSEFRNRITLTDSAEVEKVSP